MHPSPAAGNKIKIVRVMKSNKEPGRSNKLLFFHSFGICAPFFFSPIYPLTLDGGRSAIAAVVVIINVAFRDGA